MSDRMDPVVWRGFEVFLDNMADAPVDYSPAVQRKWFAAVPWVRFLGMAWERPR